MLPRSLQGKLIFLFVSLILITNLFLAIVGFSRESIYIAQETLQTAVFLGNIMRKPVLEFLQNGKADFLDHLHANRVGISAELLLTVYDANWWGKWGDGARIPPEGFPDILLMGDPETRAGPGITSREILFPIIIDGRAAGAIGIGIPPSSLQRGRTTAADFVAMLLISTLIGLAVAILAARRILLPLSDLMDGIEEFGNGDYSVRIDTGGTGELKELGDSFNRMALTVQETFKENLQRNRVIDEKLQELWEIYELMRKVTLNVEFSVILEKFLEKAQTLSFSSYGQIILQNRRNLRFESVMSSPIQGLVSQNEIENAINKCFMNKTVVQMVSGIYSIICVPMLSGSRINGVMLLAKNDAGGYSDGICRFLETIAPVLASLIENASLYEELADWNQHTKNILASISQGLATVDRQSRFLVVNERFFDFFAIAGFNATIGSFNDFCALITDQKFAELLLAEVNAYNSRIFSQEFKQYKVRKIFEYRHDEQIQLVAVNLLPLMSGQKIDGCVLVLDDVTEQKKIEQQMIEAEKWAVLGRLAASVAHEIRNPLVAISSLVEIIGEEVTGELKEHAHVVLGEVHRLNRVVAELLSLVRPEAAHLKENNLIEVINELLLLVRHEAAKNEIKLVKLFPENPCIAKVDAEKIKQAILNIVLNSFQAIVMGGKVEIEVTRQSNYFVIAVRNNGPVIENSVKAHIFEPFFTTKNSGTGLGLAITRKIAELHNGRIEFDSREGLTEFRIILPVGEVNA